MKDSDLGLSLVSLLNIGGMLVDLKHQKVYNQKDSSFGKDKFEDLVSSLSFPISKN